jgi:argininosuccinate lyase
VTEQNKNRPLWSGRFEKGPAEEAHSFSRSIHFDERLASADVAATKAHVAALERAGLLESHERRKIEAVLDEALEDLLAEKFVFHDADEDIHSAIERFVTQRLGEIGEKIHAGRSRNDLVVTDLRLWLKEVIPRIAKGVFRLEEALYRQARDNSMTLAPGYTHLQRAQPVLLPHLLLAHLFSLGRDFERMIAAFRRADVSPLGAGALAGTTLPIDPVETARDLGFAKVFDNAADAVSDRDFALEFLSTAAILAMHLSRLGEEIALWSSSEFGFVDLDDAYSTGSSIMPQKKNPDIAELARAKSARVTAHLMHLLGVTKGLPLTYNRDLQEDKEPVFDTADTLIATLASLSGMVQTISFNRARLEEAAGQASTFATDIAESLVKRGTPFRSAHELVGELVRRAEREGLDLADLAAKELELETAFDARQSVEARQSHGGTSHDRIADQFLRAEALMDDQERWLAGFGAL